MGGFDHVSKILFKSVARSAKKRCVFWERMCDGARQRQKTGLKLGKREDRKRRKVGQKERIEREKVRLTMFFSVRSEAVKESVTMTLESRTDSVY